MPWSESLILVSVSSVAGLGLLLNAGTGAFFAWTLRRRPNFTAAWCIVAIAAADSLILSLFLFPWLSRLLNLPSSSFFSCALPNFVVYTASAYSAWVLTFLSLTYSLMMYRPMMFSLRPWLRRPLTLLVAILLTCVLNQMYILFTLGQDPVRRTCVESFSLETGNALLVTDMVLNFGLPTSLSVILSIYVVCAPGMSADVSALSIVTRSTDQESLAMITDTPTQVTVTRLSSGAVRELRRRAERRMRARGLTVLALGKVACNVPSLVIRAVEMAQPEPARSWAAPWAFLLYYSQFCGQALLVFYVFARRSPSDPTTPDMSRRRCLC